MYNLINNMEIDEINDYNEFREDEKSEVSEEENAQENKKDVLILSIEDEDEISLKKKGVQYPRRQRPNYLKKDFRVLAKDTILNILHSEKNADITEKHIYNASLRLSKKKNIPITATKEFWKLYTDLLFNLCNKLNIKNLKELLSQLQQDQIELKDPFFDEYAVLRQMEESIGVSSEVEDGMYTCRHCGSTKTQQFQLQLRSGDEGMTNFIVCANSKCRKMWKQNN